MDLHNLSHLFLHGNRLWSLHQNTFRGLGALDRLLLHHNQLQWVDRLAFHDLRRLTTLYLFNNSLTELAGECLIQLPALEYLRLNDNPWECDCKALSLWDWLKKFRGSTSSVGCVAPAELSGKDLKQLRKEDFPNCSGSESLHQSKSKTWAGTDKVSLKQEPHPAQPPQTRPHHPQLNEQYPSPPSPLPQPPPAINGVQAGPGGSPGTDSAQRPGRSRNCTRQRVRGSKGKGPNEVHILKEMADKEYSSPDFTGKYDETSSDGSNTRRKHKCTPGPLCIPLVGSRKPAVETLIIHISFSVVFWDCLCSFCTELNSGLSWIRRSPQISSSSSITRPTNVRMFVCVCVSDKV